MSTRQQELVDFGLPFEFECAECGRQITRGRSGVEYGHAKQQNDSRAVDKRCPRRPECVDPIRRDHK